MPNPRSRDAPPAPSPLEAGAGAVWIRVGTLIDGLQTRPVRDAHVVYDRDAILFAGESAPPSSLVEPGRIEPHVGLPEHTLLPGLIEAHAHLFLEGGELDLEKRKSYLEQPPGAFLEAARGRLGRLVRMGIIAVRDAGDRHGTGLALSRLCREPKRPLMPFVDSPGAAIHRKGRYGSFMSGAVEDCASLEACVRARVDKGADRVKLIATGIIDFKTGRATAKPQFSARDVTALVNAAKAFGRQSFAHATGDAGIDHAIEGRVDSVEHGFFVREDQLARMRDLDIAWVPTFAPVQVQVDQAARMGWDGAVISNLRRVLDGHAASLVRAAEMGVRIIAGSDAGSHGVAHGAGLLDELEHMERAGMPALSVLCAATGAGSVRLAFRERFGQIRAGYRSRFILTRHSPLERISNLRKPRTIVFDGEVVETGENVGLEGM